MEPEEEKTRELLPKIGNTLEDETQLAPLNENIITELLSVQKISYENRYHILKTLGEGGMGVVQLVHDQVLGREVALKKIKSTVGAELTTAQQIMLWRLQREASITAILEHPNIVPLYDLEQTREGEIRFTMRKIEGETLKYYFFKKKKEPSFISEEKLLSIFFKVCEAVSYAHSKGVIHRDLKPENIMVGPFGEVYVMDWGIAKRGVDSEEETALESQEKTENEITPATQNAIDWKTVGGIGTPGYMAPEQKKDAAKVTFQADIFALGKILKESFTLHSSSEEFQLLLAYYKKFPTHKREVTIQEVLGLKLPSDLEAIIEKATHIEVAQRYQSVSALVQDLERYLKNQRISVKEYTLWETLQKWIKRNKKQILFGITIVVIIGTSFAVFKWQKQEVLWKQFQETLSQGKAFREKAARLESQGKSFRNDKIKLLLDALSCVNMALVHIMREPEAEKEKGEICDALVKLACETKDYNLACYIAREAQNLSIFSAQKKSDYLAYVTEEQNKTLTQNLERLEYWIEKLKIPITTAEMHEKAIVEISKMQEEEVLQRLLLEVENAAQYFTESTTREIKREQYYKTMITAIGHMGNIKAQETLFQTLVKIHQKITKLPTLPFGEMEFMAVIVKSLQQIQADGIATAVGDIRNELGESSIFTQQTQDAYVALTKIDGLQETNTAQIQEKITRAYIKYQQGDFTGALNDYTEALQQEADTDLESYLEGCKQLANLKQELGDSTGALEIYQIAFMYRKSYEARFPLNANILFSALYSNRSLTKASLHDYESSIEDCNEAIALESQNMYAYLNRAISYSKLKDIKKALKDFDSMIQFNPQFVEAYFNRAYARILAGDLLGALQDYQQVVRLNPKHEVAYIRIAELYADFGKPNSALTTYQEAIRVTPNNEEIYESRAVFKMRTNDLNGALADINEALKQLLNRPEIKQMQQAKKELSSQMKAKISNYYTQRGDIYSNLQIFDKAFLDYTEAIRYFPRNSAAFTNRSLLHYLQKNYQNTLEDATEAIRLDPNNFAAYTNRGFAKYYLEDNEGAKNDLKKYLELTRPLKEKDPIISNEWKDILKLFPRLDQD